MSHTENDQISSSVLQAARDDAEGYIGQAKQIVRNYAESHFDKSDPEMPYFEVYVVWFCKTLQNWKALVSTTLPDLKYYEVTYNGDTCETYLDVYLKVANVAIPAL